MSHLVHFHVNQRAFGVWAAKRGLSGRGEFDAHHAMHVLLSALFGKGMLQPYRLFQQRMGPWSVYGHSAMSAEELAKNAELVGTPEMLSVIELGDMRGKRLPAEVEAGRRIGFEIRLSPTTRADGREQDAWVSRMKQAAPADGELLERPALTREEAYGAWFARRLAGAAELEVVRMTAFRQASMLRSGKRFTAPETVLQGTLRVTDPDAFRTLYENGIGRGKAYGFGLLLLRPADPEQPF
jgi:CRISPR system Cascade subunit CasE